MSDLPQFHIQLFVTSLAATLLGAMPPIRSYQLYKAKAFETMSAKEKRITMTIFVAVTLLHIGEAIKSIAYAMLFYNRSTFLGLITYALISNCATLIAEIGRVVVIYAIISRAAEFLIKPTDTPAVRARSVLWIRFLGGLRIVWPILVAAFGAPPAIYGTFAVLMFAADAVVCTIVSIAIMLRIKERRRKELLPAISSFVLYSNSLVTLLFALLSLVIMSIMSAGINGQLNQVDSAIAFMECLPSIYVVVVGFVMCFAFWNIQEILAINSPTGTSPRRVNTTGLGRNVFTF
ncbi:hypothetical protein BASA50_010562 [Batrachochytrium salamandrivorans]|uniref:Uncharacterized protein n=1 Tax=Batrachochytrium salamandrivorans TaxID=1357716 RepID=A0ABQ8EY83_9FUNG|nr:hypothetical protein BASA60_008721 [Batrachochytrium salamandrivorans]KAH6585662.1 hypothetical protein BASA61_006779 [Batrachochytrium salamandrivorans]KAH6588691.1 hypothetical protein BASA50_010562 [Batrachochytrium salamandrivorans]KAH9265823.1 hypothetical protein BASA83_010956 [Batrachochytrium salamandrivorans]